MPVHLGFLRPFLETLSWDPFIVTFSFKHLWMLGYNWKGITSGLELLGFRWTHLSANVYLSYVYLSYVYLSFFSWQRCDLTCNRCWWAPINIISFNRGAPIKSYLNLWRELPIFMLASRSQRNRGYQWSFILSSLLSFILWLSVGFNL